MSKEATETKEKAEPIGKEAIYAELGDMVKEMTGKRIGKTGGRKIFDSVVNKIFAQAAKDGSFRFNGGMGSLHVRTYGAGKRRLPSGATTEFGERQKMRYEPGVVVGRLVDNGGDLEAAVAKNGTSKAKGETKKDESKAGEGEVELG